MPYRLILTNDDIRDDIKAFEERIEVARDKLAGLQEGTLLYRENKKREHARRILHNEILHVQNLIHIATEALVDV